MPLDVAKSPCNYCGEFLPLLQPKTICQTGKTQNKIPSCQIFSVKCVVATNLAVTGKPQKFQTGTTLRSENPWLHILHLIR